MSTCIVRSIWKGAITFGLVNVPVAVYSATEDHDIALHQVHDADGGRIRYQRKCEICGKVVPYESINKSFESAEGTVVLTDADFKSLPEERSREIDVVSFVPNEQLDPIMFERSYYLAPDGKSAKAYVLLRRTLEATDRTAIVHFALRQKTRLGALRVHGDVLLLQSLLWDDEVREASFPALDERVSVSDKELELSHALVESFAGDFAPDEFTDDYQVQLRDLIEAKLAAGDTVKFEDAAGVETDQGGGEGEVLDLMEALRRSVERSRSGEKTSIDQKRAARQSAKSKKSSA